MNTTTHNKPLGFWLAVVVEHRTHDAMRSAFADQGVSRREWRLLNVIENMPTTIEQIKAAMPPRSRRPRRERATRPETSQRRSTADVIDELIRHGWADSDDEGLLTLTTEGMRVKQGLHERVAAVRSSAGADIADADYATTVASTAGRALAAADIRHSTNFGTPRTPRGVPPLTGDFAVRVRAVKILERSRRGRPALPLVTRAVLARTVRPLRR